MLQVAFSDIFSTPQDAMRRLVAIATAPRSNAAEWENSENPEGYDQFCLSPRRFGLGVSKGTPCLLRRSGRFGCEGRAPLLLASDKIGQYRGRRYF